MRYKAVLQNNPDLNKARLAKKLGTSRVRITQLLHLLELPQNIQQKILLTRGISERALRPLVCIQNQQAMEIEFNQLINSLVS